MKSFKVFFRPSLPEVNNVPAYLKALLRYRNTLVFQWGKDNNLFPTKTTLFNINFTIYSYLNLKHWNAGRKILNKKFSIQIYINKNQSYAYQSPFLRFAFFVDSA